MGEEYKVGDKVVITVQGDGCEHHCGGGPSVGTVCTIDNISNAGLPCGNFALAYNGPHGTCFWWTTSGHFLTYSLFDDGVLPTSETSGGDDPITGPEEPGSLVVTVASGAGVIVPSLHPGSTTEYVTGHVRVDQTSLRLQGRWTPGGKGWEANTPPVTVKLREYINDLPHPCTSIASTPTKYAACRVRPDGDKVRVQIAGPALNRDWGAEFVVALENFPLHKLKAQVKAPEPASTGAPMLYPGQVVVFVADGCPLSDGPAAKIGDVGKVVAIDHGDAQVELANGEVWWTGLETIAPDGVPA